MPLRPYIHGEGISILSTYLRDMLYLLYAQRISAVSITVRTHCYELAIEWIQRTCCLVVITMVAAICVFMVATICVFVVAAIIIVFFWWF